MKKKTLIINGVLLAAFLCAGTLLSYVTARQKPPETSRAYSSPAAPSWDVSTPVPPFSFTTLMGQNQHIVDFAGQVVLINFWASWCMPCLAEFPSLMRLADRFPERLTLIALSSDSDRAAMERFLEKMKAAQGALPEDMIVVHDKDKSVTRDVFGIVRLPETLLINKDGIIIEHLIGAEWQEQDLHRQIEAAFE